MFLATIRKFKLFKNNQPSGGSEFSSYEIELRKMTSYFELLTRSRKIKCRLLTAKSRSVRGASRQPASMGSMLTICQTCLPCPHLVDGCGRSPGFSIDNKQTVKSQTRLQVVAWWLWRRPPTAEASVRIPRKANCISSFCHEIDVEKRWGREIRGYV